MSSSKTFRSRLRRVLWIFLAALTIVVVSTIVAFKSSPWPSALVIRWLFERGGHATNAALEARVPSGIRTVAGVRYDPNDPDALLDIYRPSILDGRPLPVIFWIHGGGYVGGSREVVANYARILAADGYAVVTPDYALAPGAQYPVPVKQLGHALAFLSGHAAELKLDSSRIVLGGDSAGAQLASQLAALASSPDYAQATGLDAGISIAQLRGLVLFCGPHDGRIMASQVTSSWFLRTVMWSYFGSVTPSETTVQAFSVVPHVSHSFPPAFISVGNGDPLAPQSIALADALRQQGVPVETLFYAASHKPPLAHEYQFNLSLPESREALRRTRAFLRERQSLVSE
jgi:acetyl esterase